MILRKLCWLAVEGCLVWLFIRFGSAAALMLAGAMLLLVLVSIPVNLWIRSRLRLELSAKPILRKGETGVLIVRVVNPAPIPVSIRCRLRIRNLLNGGDQKLNVIVSCAGKEQSFTAELGSAHCGRLRISVEKLWLYDCFGLIGIPAKSHAVCHVTVQPECFESRITLQNVMDHAEDSDAYAQDRPGWDLTETFQLREYVPGDSPRQIHWKLSGKLDRLVVRDPGLPIVQNVLIFWERNGDFGGPDQTDAQAEAVVSIARALLDQSVQFRLGWNDAEESRCIFHEITDLEELIGVMPRLLSAAGTQGGDSGAGLLLQTTPDALCSHMVYVAASPAPEVLDWENYGIVTVLSCGDSTAARSVLFDAENYAAQLAVLEL